MRLTLRFVLPLTLALALVTYLILPWVDSLTLKWFVRDLDIRSKMISQTMSDVLPDMLQNKSNVSLVRLSRYLDTATQDERLFAVGICGQNQQMIVATKMFPTPFNCGEMSNEPMGESRAVKTSTGSLHWVQYPLEIKGQPHRLILIHDMSFIDRRSADTRKYVFFFFVGLGLLISLITVVIAQLSVRGLLLNIRNLLKGNFNLRQDLGSSSPELLPLAKDVRALVRELERDRRQRDESQISWTPKNLKAILQKQLVGDEVLIVSNREPYIHVKKGDQVEIQTPASGLVTALEPVMRACSGTWIAHGGGSADRESVDENDHVRVPPGDPSYQIRRVWLTEEEEKGYYYGFSNEGLWPLCHIAHTRPTFRTSDWEQYVKVNQKFADAVVEEAKTDDPVVLVQDYHFALLPRMIRNRLPKATIITFWHIPWPNPEAFGICPWRDEILDGLLGSSIVGFHTKFHCNNFIDTVDRYLEARIDREDSTISYGGKLSAVKSYPISIEWPPQWIKTIPSIKECASSVRAELGLDSQVQLAVGVDRLDYTKGILERFRAVERLLELHPEWIGKFSMVQIAAPSRSVIDEYKKFGEEVVQVTHRINQRFQTANWKPIILKLEHHSASEVYRHYRAANVCMVTSLHDGMNLVAKEFIASREDEQGVLILSQFAGASRELPESIVVNPYNVDQCADAIEQALRMSAQEQKERMQSMRGLVQEFNVYRWAGRMLMDAARMRQYQRLLGKIRS